MAGLYKGGLFKNGGLYLGGLFAPATVPPVVPPPPPPPPPAVTRPVAFRGTPSKTVLQSVKDKLVAGLKQPDGSSVPDGFVRVIARPNPGYAHFRPEPGVAVCMRSPDPRPLSGAGRNGVLVSRLIEVHVASMNLLDEAGSDTGLVYGHADLEDAVMEALIPDPAVPLPAPAITVKFVPGGLDIERMVKVDSGMAYSALLFEVLYVPPLTAYRG